MTKQYFLPNNEHPYLFEEITEKILRGELVKKSLIWEKSMPDWTYLEKIDEFSQVFKEYEKIADEKLKKAMGTDDESVKKREMRQLLTEYDGEDLKLEGKHSFLKKLSVFAVILIISGVASFWFYKNSSNKEAEKTPKEQPSSEKLNIEDIDRKSVV